MVWWLTEHHEEKPVRLCSSQTIKRVNASYGVSPPVSWLLRQQKGWRPAVTPCCPRGRCCTQHPRVSLMSHTHSSFVRTTLLRHPARTNEAGSTGGGFPPRSYNSSTLSSDLDNQALWLVCCSQAEWYTQFRPSSTSIKPQFGTQSSLSVIFNVSKKSLNFSY